MRYIILLFFVSLGLGKASASYEHYAQKLHSQNKSVSQKSSPGNVPGFKTDTPPEIKLDDSGALGEAVGSVYSTHPHAQSLKSMAETRPYFRIDLEKDPLVKNSTLAVEAPEKVIENDLHNRKPQLTYTIKKCQEAKPATEFKCSKNLLPPEIHVDPAKYSHYWCTSGNHQPDDSRCRAKRYYNPARKYKDEVIHVIKEEWISTCQNLENLQKAGVCQEIRKVCTDGPNAREVSGTLGTEKTPIVRMLKRDCWRYEHIYACHASSVNNCAPLRKSSCEQYVSKCIQKVGETCVEWEQTFRCPDKVLEETSDKVGESGYKLAISQPSLKVQPNKDFNEAMTKLSVFDAIQKDMREKGDGQSIHVFKGESRKCTIAFGNFKNCCTNGKGWGVSLNLSGCDGEEKDLAERQSKKLCVEIGTYCAEKLPIIGCIRKKRAYCCFPSKLSRILHEQGRGQIGKGWGEPEHPRCTGFTPEELASLNFDNLDLSELYSDIVSNAKHKTIKTIERNLSDRVSHMTHSFKNQSKEGVY